MIRVNVTFYSYFRELTGVGSRAYEVAVDSTLGDLLQTIHAQFPELARMSRATLLAVGVEYQTAAYILRDQDEVALFPPVQGG